MGKPLQELFIEYKYGQNTVVKRVLVWRFYNTGGRVGVRAMQVLLRRGF